MVARLGTKGLSLQLGLSHYQDDG